MIKAAIVGCGNIAGFLDTPQDSNIITHAHAYNVHPKTQLAACTDTATQQMQDFCARWGDEIRPYDSLETMLETERPDMVSVCSSTPSHAAILNTLLKKEYISTIICEKPLVQTMTELDALEKSLNVVRKKLVVNYMRRYDPSILEAVKLVKEQKFGRALNFKGSFSKGLYHNGSHMIELIENFFGALQSFQSIEHHIEDDDAFGVFYLKAPECSGIINNISGEEYALFELEITLEKGRILIRESGHEIVIESVQPSAHYPGYNKLGFEYRLEDSLCHNALHTVEYAVKSLSGSVEPFSHLDLSRRLLEIRNMLFTSQKTFSWSH